jgi:hypothetical protein
MKVLLIEPLKHPCKVEIENKLDAMYAALECDTITAVYPWDEPIALVTDDEGLLRNKMPNRYIRELGQYIAGNFFLCGIEGEDFADMPGGLMAKYMERFWRPEVFLERF